MKVPMEPEHPEHEPERELERTHYFERPEAMEQPMSRIDLSRWGPIWAGFMVTIGVVVLLGLPAAALGLTATAAGATLSGAGIYAAIILLIGLFIGGWLSSRLAAVGGTFLGLIQGSLVWALTIFISLILTAIGAGAILGSYLGGFGPVIAGGSTVTGAGSTAVWVIFLALLVGLVVAAVGGWVGARSPYEAPPR